MAPAGTWPWSRGDRRRIPDRAYRWPSFPPVRKLAKFQAIIGRPAATFRPIADPGTVASERPLTDRLRVWVRPAWLTQEGLAMASVQNRPQTLHEAFRKQVERSGSRTAMVCGDRALSYWALDARSDAVARK